MHFCNDAVQKKTFANCCKYDKQTVDVQKSIIIINSFVCGSRTIFFVFFKFSTIRF